MIIQLGCYYLSTLRDNPKSVSFASGLEVSAAAAARASIDAPLAMEQSTLVVDMSR